MRIVSVVCAIAAGIIVLLGYFLPIEPLPTLRGMLLYWAFIMAGMAALVGILSLIFVQLEKIRSREKGSVYGALLILSLLATLIFGMVLGPNNALINMAVNGVIQPVEATLLAMLTVTLIYASIRMLRRRVDVMSVVFLITAFITLIAFIPTPFGQIPVIGDFIGPLINSILAVGGARGLLIGIALGSLLTGLRVLFGIDRPYGGN